MKIIGHRGAAGRAAENSLAAIDRALHCNVWGVEIDARLTSDGEFVLCHDASLKRLSGSRRKVQAMTLAELQSFKVQGSDQYATLSDSINHIHTTHPNVYILIECKGSGWAAAMQQFLSALPEAVLCRIILLSFHKRELHRLQLQMPYLKVIYSYHLLPTRSALMRVKARGAYGICCRVTLYNIIQCALAARIGLRLFVYTINQPGKLKQLRKLGVEYLITDFPDRFAILNRKRSSPHG